MLEPSSSTARALALLTLITASVLIPPLDAANPDSATVFKQDVLPILKSHCVRCHGPDKQESRIRLDNLSTDLVQDRAAAEYWNEVLHVLNAGEMPPDDEPQLSASQNKVLTNWISTAIREAIEAGRSTDGRAVLRRLNRTEYQNTMFDLLGLEMDYARDLPPDPPSSDGFRNNGNALHMSALQLEYYLATARRALSRVIVSGPAPPVYQYQFSEGNVGNWLGGTERSSRLGRRQAFLAKMVDDYPEQGAFRIQVEFTADLKPAVGFPLLEVSVGYRPDTKILFREVQVVEITSGERQFLEFYGRVENHPLPVRGQGKYPGLIVQIRNRYDDNSPLPKGKDNVFPDEPHLPTITIHSVEFEAPVCDTWPPTWHQRILFDSPLRATDELAYTQAVLERFMRRAYRRPVTTPEVMALVDFFQAIRPEFPTLEDAMRETLAMVLIRPDFLYLLEPAEEEKRQINDWEFASRLSYFLWSTMPDAQLLETAATGTLQQPNVLSQEVERLLSDPRSDQFVQQFTEQWLHLDVVDQVAINRDYYPQFKERLKTDMRQESEQVFGEILRHNLSALHFLSSDFTMLNGRLARHYGIDEVYGNTFRRVTLSPKQHRGGLLGHASILLSNSTGADSHVIRRAVWIRDRLLNDPPASPPPNVPSLEQTNKDSRQLSIREQLEAHRGTKSCARCHRDIDPWGIALEHFDAVGLWRDEIRHKSGKEFITRPVAATATLPNGQQLTGIDELKSYLVSERQTDFARALVSRILGYSVGRRIELSDRETIADLTKQFIADEFRLRNLVKNIIKSKAFQTK